LTLTFFLTSFEFFYSYYLILAIIRLILAFLDSRGSSWRK
jgi:hypothetical protein